ncbi:MAG: ATP-binding cassette domain-containing protein, partial [Pseudomonadota bacterium]
MATIHLKDLQHSYAANPTSEADWALKRVDLQWRDGGAYALLGPSGCGKSTLLNIISGLITPTKGQILFDGHDVTEVPPNKREIAQVFQFPVVYDTMTSSRTRPRPIEIFCLPSADSPAARAWSMSDSSSISAISRT